MKIKELDNAREQINNIDKEMALLFEKRLETSVAIATIKQKNNVSIVDYKREEQVEKEFCKDINSKYTSEARAFSRVLMAFSKMIQRKELFGEKNCRVFPLACEKKLNPTVAFAGVKGAWSEAAAAKLFPDASPTPMEYFDDVFKAVSNGLIDYGIVPIENSKSGAIGEVYDLLRRYGCFIVGQTWLPINHCLMAKKGTAINDITAVYSHPEGFAQCADFIKNHKLNCIATTNTAVAAELVSKSEEHIAAIASYVAANTYSLDVLFEDIITDKNNRTRFIVISKNPQYTSSSNTISITFKTLHKSGALCDVIFRFMEANINLSRIESRPNGNGEYMFFVDIDGNIEDENIISALNIASGSCVYLEVLGCFE